jgi:quercetin dioxygenase-like cupin family protein
MKLRSILTAATAALALTVAPPVLAHGAGETVTTNFEKEIPNIPGKALVAIVVDYAPGAESAPHAHAKSAFVYAYVISGEIESKINDGPARVYKAGESFYEPPASLHPISRNASKTKPARLLAVFVLDNDEIGEITTALDQH